MKIKRHTIKSNIIVTIEQGEVDPISIVELETKLNESKPIVLNDGSKCHLRYHFKGFKTEKEK